ncbi:MAG: hypothetical protein IJ308_04230 [Clostridia bacterium]|nr:hypothetical protein [Clostridia bacterium]
MDLSNEQFQLLKVFCEREIIPYSDLPKYKTQDRSPLIRSLTKNSFIKTIELYPKDGYPTYTLAYKIQPNGKAAYESHVRKLKSHSLQKRQTIANEEAVEEAKKANKKSSFSLVLSIIAIIVSIVAIIVEISK